MEDIKQYVIFGGSGYFGSNFIHNLMKNDSSNKIIINIDLVKPSNVQKSKNYYYLQYDLSDVNNAEKIFNDINDISNNNPLNKRILINFAAQSFVDTSLSSPELTLENNVNILFEMLTLTSQMKFDEIIHISTDEVHIVNKKDIKDVSAYALSKKMCEDILLKLSSESKIFKIVRPVNLYGVINRKQKYGLWQRNKCIITRLIDAYKHPDVNYELYLSESARHFINIQRACDTLMEIISDNISETKIYLMKYDFHIVIKDLILSFIDRYSLKNISIINRNLRGKYEDEGYFIPEMKKYDVNFDINDFWKIIDWMLNIKCQS